MWSGLKEAQKAQIIKNRGSEESKETSFVLSVAFFVAFHPTFEAKP